MTESEIPVTTKKVGTHRTQADHDNVNAVFQIMAEAQDDGGDAIYIHGSAAQLFQGDLETGEENARRFREQNGPPVEEEDDFARIRNRALQQGREEEEQRLADAQVRQQMGSGEESANDGFGEQPTDIQDTQAAEGQEMSSETEDGEDEQDDIEAQSDKADSQDDSEPTAEASDYGATAPAARYEQRQQAVPQQQSHEGGGPASALGALTGAFGRSFGAAAGATAGATAGLAKGLGDGKRQMKRANRAQQHAQTLGRQGHRIQQEFDKLEDTQYGQAARQYAALQNKGVANWTDEDRQNASEYANTMKHEAVTNPEVAQSLRSIRNTTRDVGSQMERIQEDSEAGFVDADTATNKLGDKATSVMDEAEERAYGMIQEDGSALQARIRQVVERIKEAVQNISALFSRQSAGQGQSMST